MKINSAKIKINILYLMIFTSSFVVLQIANRTIFLWFQLLYVIISLIIPKKVIFYKDHIYNFIYVSIGFSMISAFRSELPRSYQRAATYWFIIYAIILFIVTDIHYEFTKGNGTKIVEVVTKAFKAMSIVQLIWVPLQFVSYHLGGVDINELIFVRTLNCVKEASFVRNWVWYPSGLTWHSAILAPMFVFDLLLFKNKIVILLIVIDAFICGSSTAIVGVVLTITIEFLHWLFYEKKVVVKRGYIAFILAISTITTLLVVNPYLIDNMLKQLAFLLRRISGASNDASTSAHLQYYYDYLDIAKKSSLTELLFGYGEGTSGYWISKIYSRYSDLKSWSVESDIVDKLLSRGIIGTIAFYCFLFKIGIKGKRISYKYLLLTVVLFIQGFGYNIQFDYIFLMESLVYIAMVYKIDFFEAKHNQQPSRQLYGLQ